MVRLSALFTLALATVSLATTNSQCQKEFNSCRVGADANQAQCSANHAQCCSDAFDTCRSGPDANQAQCAADNAACKGQK
ncbi:hypothetical protein LT330_009105 [Penicillium expansum]|uniref:Uncharacterized protein n=1 Tax=Penicillium expansum TaxID=27334 RepID=A0A0A2KDS9_PENEN|nr:hypothetical protein PEX2_108080 [Penicillium expansum]KAJ5491843.1 hypothetical protein N7453_009940 [Penicillium expansum]KAK4865672.1 hypothetical protein LT330_009105 [Penicillium expansum]KGO41708.1 hypothetical protein PEXP_089200 [Penicillium expansum]KGO52149.1 hypothetical protein PEX2_108080 [Penicillium expansum]KGO62510.1 hypothetical protein PEX1_065480 [Penicillium expansum]